MNSENLQELLASGTKEEIIAHIVERSPSRAKNAISAQLGPMSREDLVAYVRARITPRPNPVPRGCQFCSKDMEFQPWRAIKNKIELAGIFLCIGCRRFELYTRQEYLDDLETAKRASVKCEWCGAEKKRIHKDPIGNQCRHRRLYRREQDLLCP